MKNESPHRGQTAGATAVVQVQQAKFTASSTPFQASSIISAGGTDHPTVGSVKPHKG
jgi:hypothetical protein